VSGKRTGLAGTEGSPKFARFIMGQAARFWSPDHKPLSLILDSIHELDLAAHLLGPITSIRGRSTELACEVHTHHPDGSYAVVSMNRTADPPVRIAVVTTPDDERAIRLRTDDDMYTRELQYFLQHVAKGEQTFNPLTNAAAVCRAALEVA
jgi:hypothetical protein